MAVHSDEAELDDMNDVIRRCEDAGSGACQTCFRPPVQRTGPIDIREEEVPCCSMFVMSWDTTCLIKNNGRTERQTETDRVREREREKEREREGQRRADADRRRSGKANKETLCTRRGASWSFAASLLSRFCSCCVCFKIP